MIVQRVCFHTPVFKFSTNEYINKIETLLSARFFYPELLCTSLIYFAELIYIHWFPSSNFLEASTRNILIGGSGIFLTPGKPPTYGNRVALTESQNGWVWKEPNLVSKSMTFSGKTHQWFHLHYSELLFPLHHPHHNTPLCKPSSKVTDK